MNVSVSQQVPLDARSITSRIYDDGQAYIELGTGLTPSHSILIWVGRDGVDFGQEAAALRKLAAVASDLAAGLERRAVTS